MGFGLASQHPRVEVEGPHDRNEGHEPCEDPWQKVLYKRGKGDIEHKVSKAAVSQKSLSSISNNTSRQLDPKKTRLVQPWVDRLPL